MTIQREIPGVTLEMVAMAKERVLPKSGVVLVPYQAEWDDPDVTVRMYGYEERYAETLGLVDTIELAAEGGATIIGYRMTNGNASAAKYTQAGAIEISARYPGTSGVIVKGDKRLKRIKWWFVCRHMWWGDKEEKLFCVKCGLVKAEKMISVVKFSGFDEFGCNDDYQEIKWFS